MLDAPRYIDSYYQATANRQLDLPSLQEDETVDVCVIGAGYTGLSSAIHLAERGYRVVVLEAERVAWGASGRNGGHCNMGQREPQELLEKKFGIDEAKSLWNLSLEAIDTVRHLIERFEIHCDLKRGNLEVAAKRSDADWYRYHRDHMQKNYGFEYRFVENEELSHLSGSEAFVGGLVEYESAHLHPLNYALGLADAARALPRVLCTLATWCLPAMAISAGWNNVSPAESCRSIISCLPRNHSVAQGSRS
jgi:gamma-glutamylputrescine oxidase